MPIFRPEQYRGSHLTFTVTLLRILGELLLLMLMVLVVTNVTKKMFSRLLFLLYGIDVFRIFCLFFEIDFVCSDFFFRLSFIFGIVFSDFFFSRFVYFVFLG